MRGIRIEHRPGRPKPYILTVSAGGQRKREGFASAAEAERAKAKAEAARLKGGEAGRDWNPDIYREWRAARDIVADPSVGLAEVALFWRDHAKRDCPSLPVPEAVEIFLAEKEAQGIGERHLRDLRSRCRAFASDQKKCVVSHLTTAAVLDWLRRKGGAPRTQKNNRVAIGNFLEFSARRGWTDTAPKIIAADLPRIRTTSKGVLSVDEARRLFAWLEGRAPEWCAWFALQAFAGIRSAEAEKMESVFLDTKNRRIMIPKRICKTGDDWRMTGLPENLWAWLERYAPEGPIPFPSSRPLDRLRAEMVAAGIVAQWPANALRHSFATYHMSAHESADKTALLMRHRSTAMLWQSYLSTLVSSAEAAEYFAIVPCK